MDVLGVSLGSVLAENLAAENPERFGKVILIPNLNPPSPLESLVSLIPFISSSSLENFIQRERDAHDAKKIKEAVDSSYRYTREPASQDVGRVMDSVKPKSTLKNIKQPVLLIVGKKDNRSTRNYASRLHKIMPDSKITFIEEAKSPHLIYEKSDQTARLIEDFLKNGS